MIRAPAGGWAASTTASTAPPTSAVDGLLRAGVKWPVIHATGIDGTYHTLKRDAANGTEQTAPRQ